MAQPKASKSPAFTPPNPSSLMHRKYNPTKPTTTQSHVKSGTLFLKNNPKIGTKNIYIAVMNAIFPALGSATKAHCCKFVAAHNTTPTIEP